MFWVWKDNDDNNYGDDSNDGSDNEGNDNIPVVPVVEVVVVVVVVAEPPVHWDKHPAPQCSAVFPQYQFYVIYKIRMNGK